MRKSRFTEAEAEAFYEAEIALRGDNTLARPLRERDIERHLVHRVEALGGEVRKVQWVGRRGAPDRLVMLPRQMTQKDIWQRSAIWVELKAPGKLATFPADAHERAQHREHERMRKMGQRVVVIDSIEGVKELLS